MAVLILITLDAQVVKYAEFDKAGGPNVMEFTSSYVLHLRMSLFLGKWKMKIVKQTIRGILQCEQSLWYIRRL